MSKKKIEIEFLWLSSRCCLLFFQITFVGIFTFLCMCVSDRQQLSCVEKRKWCHAKRRQIIMGMSLRSIHMHSMSRFMVWTTTVINYTHSAYNVFCWQKRNWFEWCRWHNFMRNKGMPWICSFFFVFTS